MAESIDASTTPGGRIRAALAPFAWLAVVLLAASVLALGVALLLPGSADAGPWSPTWSFAEVHLRGADAGTVVELLAEGRRLGPEREIESRASDDGVWIVLVGPANRLELAGELRELAAGHGLAPDRIGFGSNLARITARLLADPSAAADAAGALLPLTLFGGSAVLLVAGALLRRRLPRSPAPAEPRPRSRLARVLTGIGLGALLALLVEGLGALLAALGHPLVEQPWVGRLVARGGPALWAAVPLVVGLAPLGEEVLFRGYLLEALRPAWGRAGALLLSSAAFAAVHGHGPALPAYFLYGLGLGLAARRSGTLLVPVVAHVTVNALALATLAWAGG